MTCVLYLCPPLTKKYIYWLTKSPIPSGSGELLRRYMSVGCYPVACTNIRIKYLRCPARTKGGKKKTKHGQHTQEFQSVGRVVHSAAHTN